MLKEEYFVNKDAGTVTCVLWSQKVAAMDYINKHFMQNNLGIYYQAYNFNEKFHMPAKFVGLARCSVHDEFDVEIGKRIARRRAMELYQKSLWKHISNIYDSMTAAMVEMEDKIFF